MVAQKVLQSYEKFLKYARKFWIWANEIAEKSYFMKKNIVILLITVLTPLLSAPVWAQNRQYIGVWGQLGEASLLPSESTLPTALGVGGGLGFNYELRAGKHFLLDFGLGANCAHSIFSTDNREEILYDMVDTENWKFDYTYKMTERKDAYTNLSVQVPLMLGAHFHRFYFLAGAKFDMSVYVPTTVKMNISTEGVYHQFIDPMTGMPEHFFYSDVPYKHSGKVTFRPNVMASAEIGWRLGPIYTGTGADIPKQRTQYRLGLFADYGLLDVHRAQTLPMLQIPSAINTDDPTGGVIANDCLSVIAAAGKVNNLMVGVKFSVYFQLPEKKACVICHESRPRPQSARGLLD